MNDLTPQITQGASDPASISSDGQSVSPKPIDQLIKADQYLNNRASITRRRQGMYFRKLVVPGALSDRCSGPGGFGRGCCGV